MDESDDELFLETSASSEEILPEKTKRKTLVAPWKNVEEFNKVYSWIYGEKATNETKQLACRQMVIWKIRRINLTPAAVLGTLVILEIQLKDAQIGSSGNVEQMKDLQLLYSSAFTRFFNYMSSIMQTQNMKTMYETAKDLNLRSFVVDLRHMCAHGQTMPSIEVLRSTSKYCLRWLEDFYWRGQSECMLNVDTRNIRRKDRTQFEENVVQLFRFYDAALECALKGEQKLSKKYVKGEKYIAIKAYIEKKGVTDLNLLLGEIVKDLGMLVRQERTMMDLSEIYMAAVLRMRFFFNLVGGLVSFKAAEFDDFFAETHTGTEKQLEVLVQQTQGLFRMLAIYGLIENLFHSLLAIVENKNEEVPRRNAAGFWANQLVLGFIAFRRCKEVYKIEREQNPNKDYDLKSLNFDNTSKKVLQFYTRVGINVKRTLIFGDTVRRPWVWTFDRNFIEERLRHVNEYSVEILKNILYLVEPQLTDDEINTLKVLFDLNISNELCTESIGVQIDAQVDADKVYTAEDVLRHIGSAAEDYEMQDVTTAERGVKKYGVWSTAPECQDWCACPIGGLIWD